MTPAMPTIDTTTNSETLVYAEGLIDVYGDGKGGVLLTVRREPRDIYGVRSVEMTAAQAAELARALVAGTGPVDEGALADELDIVEAVEAEREACAQVAEGGRFLHDDAPDARFGRECAAAIRRRTT
jgi:hypothetical protein